MHAYAAVFSGMRFYHKLFRCNELRQNCPMQHMQFMHLKESRPLQAGTSVANISRFFQ